MNTKNTKEAINQLEMKFDGEDLPRIIELVPSEEIIIGFDGRTFKALDKQAIVKATNSKLKYLVIDENHRIDYTHGTGQSAEAMGWMHDFFVREDNSIWALAEWTYSGAEKIRDKAYKYISPVYEIDKSGNIISILRAAITNNPNLKLTALNENKNKQGENMSYESKINVVLGLKEDASDSEVANSIFNLKNECESFKKELNSLQKEKDCFLKERAELEKALNEVNKELAELKRTEMEKEARSIVEKAINQGKIAPSTKNVYVALCMEAGGIEKFEKIMENTPQSNIFKETNIPNGTGKEVQLNEADEEVAKAMGYSREEMLNIKKKEL